MSDLVEPDTKDWTWVLAEPCEECGFDASRVDRGEIGERIRRSASLWAPVLAAAEAGTRPDPGTWSPSEYACHVRDVHRVFGVRLGSMLGEDDPLFDDWDQDATAVEAAYADQDPTTVGPELLEAAATVAATYDAVLDDAWGRRGRRSNGSEFTVETLGRYHLHDVEHHAWDVRGAATAATVAAYEQHARGYGAGLAPLPVVVRERLDHLARRVGRGSRVLEIGSGPGRDASHLEEQGGLSVLRTDITRAFVEILRAEGHRAEVVDPLVDDLADPVRPGEPWDAVWANACLLHVARTDLPVVLQRLAAVTRPGGVLALSLKEGDGEGWSEHGSITAPRRFVYWREAPLTTAVQRAGWDVDGVTVRDGLRDERWVMVEATRRG